MAIKVVAFGVDGTLMAWPSGRVQPVEVQRLLADWGIEISYQAYEAARYGVLVLDEPKREILGWTDFLALLFARMNVAVSVDLLACLTAMHEKRDDMESFADAVPALQAARARGLRTCSFTTLPAFMLGRRAADLRGLLDYYFNCGTVGMAKGDRRFYRRITEHLGVAAEEILCIGDDPIGDCLIPAEVGWRAVLLDRHGGLTAARANQTATIRTLMEIGAILDQGNEIVRE
jgi:FMN phosphatase YigB (HAD superfamily)